METINVAELKPLLGKTFKDTLIVDPVLGPYFILRYEEGGWGVLKTRRDSSGNLKYRALAYPATFMGSLEYVAKELQNESGKVYESIQDYISNWTEICNKIRNVYKDWKVNLI